MFFIQFKLDLNSQFAVSRFLCIFNTNVLLNINFIFFIAIPMLKNATFTIFGCIMQVCHMSNIGNDYHINVDLLCKYVAQRGNCVKPGYSAVRSE